jgi:hypothetical protein
MNKGGKKTIQIIYDKQCPACHYYCNIVRIKESIGELHLINAREDSAVMVDITKRGWDIDQGMVLGVDGELYYGAEAIHMLALLGSASNSFNRFNYWLFSSKKRAAILYPLLKSLRNLLLKILRKTKINNLKIKENSRF